MATVGVKGLSTYLTVLLSYLVGCGLVAYYSHRPGYACDRVSRPGQPRSNSLVPPRSGRCLQFRARRGRRLATVTPSRRLVARRQAARRPRRRRRGSAGPRWRSDRGGSVQIPSTVAGLPTQLRHYRVHNDTLGRQTHTTDRRPTVFPPT